MSAGGAETPNSEPLHLENVASLSMQRTADAMAAGAAIAVLRVRSAQEPTVAQKIARGTVSLSLEQTLFGSLPESIEVVYAYRADPIGVWSDYAPIWADAPP